MDDRRREEVGGRVTDGIRLQCDVLFQSQVSTSFTILGEPVV